MQSELACVIGWLFYDVAIAAAIGFVWWDSPDGIRAVVVAGLVLAMLLNHRWVDALSDLAEAREELQKDSK